MATRGRAPPSSGVAGESFDVMEGFEIAGQPLLALVPPAECEQAIDLILPEARPDGVGGHIGRYDGTRGDDGSVPDGHAVPDQGAGPDPYVIAYGDGQLFLEVIPV